MPLAPRSQPHRPRRRSAAALLAALAAGAAMGPGLVGAHWDPGTTALRATATVTRVAWALDERAAAALDAPWLDARYEVLAEGAGHHRSWTAILLGGASLPTGGAARADKVWGHTTCGPAEPLALTWTLRFQARPSPSLGASALATTNPAELRTGPGSFVDAWPILDPTGRVVLGAAEVAYEVVHAPMPPGPGMHDPCPG